MHRRSVNCARLIPRNAYGGVPNVTAATSAHKPAMSISHGPGRPDAENSTRHVSCLDLSQVRPSSHSATAPVWALGWMTSVRSNGVQRTVGTDVTGGATSGCMYRFRRSTAACDGSLSQ